MSIELAGLDGWVRADALERLAAACPDDDGDGLTLARRLASMGVIAAAAGLALIPAMVAAAAIVAPATLEHLGPWLLAVGVGFSIVAVARVPAGAVIVVVLSRRRTAQ